MKPMWLIQTNCQQKDFYEKAVDICKKHHIHLEGYKSIPFLDDPLESVDYDGPVIVYGSTTLMRRALLNPQFKCGLFANEETLKPSVWTEKLKTFMLNHDLEVTTLNEALNLDLPPEFFLRPNSDLKTFCGNKLTKHELDRFIYGVSTGGYPFETSIEVIIAPLKNVIKEYRIWVVDDKIVSASQYKSYSSLRVINEVPKEVVHFVNRVKSIWEPDKAYVIDIAQVGEKYYVIEYNCINASGTYACNLENIILSLTNYVGKQYALRCNISR